MIIVMKQFGDFDLSVLTTVKEKKRQAEKEKKEYMPY